MPLLTKVLLDNGLFFSVAQAKCRSVMFDYFFSLFLFLGPSYLKCYLNQSSSWYLILIFTILHLGVCKYYSINFYLSACLSPVKILSEWRFMSFWFTFNSRYWSGRKESLKLGWMQKTIITIIAWMFSIKESFQLILHSGIILSHLNQIILQNLSHTFSPFFYNWFFSRGINIEEDCFFLALKGYAA